MNKRSNIVWCLSLACLLFIAACSSTEKKDKLAGYVGAPENGLTKKQLADSNEVVCQLVPQQKPEKGSGNVYKFNVYMKTKPEQMNDSLLYQFNYHSTDIFRLVSNGDTIRPVLSERVANGRSDKHEFTVVFDIENSKVNKSDLSFMILSNNLFQKDLVFDYKYNDITKASKLLYGYDQVND